MNEWQLLGLQPVDDKRAIKRAYAKLIKTIDPAIEPERFQSAREAYQYLLDYGRHYVDDSVEDDDNEFSINLDEEPISFAEDSFDYSDVKEQKISIEITSESSIEDSSELAIESSDSSARDTLLPFQQEPPDQELNSSEQLTEQNDVQNTKQQSVSVKAFEQASSTKNSYELADEAIDEMRRLLQSSETQSIQDWKTLLAKEEYQFFDVLEHLRTQVFGVFVEKLTPLYEPEGNLDKVNLRLLKERMPSELDKVIKYCADYFDWKNSELMLANYFEFEEMNLVGFFYLERIQPTTIDEEKKSTIGSYFFWFVLIVILMKVFGSIETKRNANIENGNESFLSDVLDRNNQGECESLSQISTDLIANECTIGLTAKDNKTRFVIAFYWLKRFEESNSVIDKQSFFNKAHLLLLFASDNNYLPAINILSGIYLGGHYNERNIEEGVKWLDVGASLNDPRSILVLAANRYHGYWQNKNIDEAKKLYDRVSVESLENEPNLKYVLAAAYWLGLKKNISTENGINNKDKAKLMFRQHRTLVADAYLNNAAWFFAVASDEDFDSVLSLELAREFKDDGRRVVSWQFLDTLAAAYAANQDYINAIKYSKESLKLLSSNTELTNEEMNRTIKLLENSLELFKNGKRITVRDDYKDLERLLARAVDGLMRFDLNKLPQ